MGAYASARREEDRRPDSYTWRGRKQGRDSEREERREGQREGGKKGGRDRGREDQSMSNFKSIHFLYLKFDALWPLDNSDVKDLTKMNQEVCIKNASIM